jgi:DNA-binding transcriptional ArsR family regulator
MSLTNRLGDLELTDPRAMRALAHPVRLAILDHLQRHGPATATQLSPAVGATPSVTSWHLRHLARFGLVRDSDAGEDRRQRWWEAVARGIRFEVPDDEEGRSAARQLASQMFAQYDHLPRQWMVTDEPRLPDEWRRLGGLANTRVMLTADELARLEDQVEALLAPYVTRAPADRPPDARGVRLMRYTLPEATEPTEPARYDDAGAEAAYDDPGDTA